ncbi:MAG TPA: phytanoyl-CoA dioxygenase family protein [Bryobacteraceae bacterium]|nr:phytanoyl-CoA dioxygenase family protein [Bryobacteraceae bacterium]
MLHQRQIAADGFAVTEKVLPDAAIATLIAATGSHLEHGRGGIRNLLALGAVARLAESQAIRDLVEPVLGADARAVRGTLFDKTPDANWKVPWHQDLSIAVQQRVDLDGYGPWSVKAGVVHVQPPVDILEKMLAVRIHLDDCHEENGVVRVIPGSHAIGRLSVEKIGEITAIARSVSCPVRAGGVLLMRPLLLHASSASSVPSHRRVIHVDYASAELPAGLSWFQK